MKAPAIFKTAASSTARRGLRTWVETTVAMALALSCQPFEKSNARARITTNTSRVVGSNMIRWEASHDAGGMASHRLDMFQQNALEDVGHILTPIGPLLEALVDLFPFDDDHRILFALEQSGDSVPRDAISVV